MSPAASTVAKLKGFGLDFGAHTFEGFGMQHTKGEILKKTQAIQNELSETVSVIDAGHST